jgi:hypothetical protein
MRRSETSKSINHLTGFRIGEMYNNVVIDPWKIRMSLVQLVEGLPEKEDIAIFGIFGPRSRA